MPIQKRRITAGAVTTTILILLLVAGPAQAFTINLQTKGTSEVEQGKTITITASVDINSGENIPIQELVLILDGPEHRECTFDVTGKIKSGTNTECHGINIKKTPQPKINQNYGYNYGYYNGHNYNFGYNYGITSDLQYEITIHTQKFSVGKYNTQLKIKTQNQEFSNQGTSFEITQKTTNKEQKEKGGSPTGCLTVWECTDWTKCTEGEQTRQCYKAENYCTLKKEDKKPEEKRNCDVQTIQTAQTNTQEEQENQPEPTTLETKQTLTKAKPQKPNALSRITGAVSGVSQEQALGATIVTVITAGMLIIALKLLINKRKIKKFFNYKKYDFY